MINRFAILKIRRNPAADWTSDNPTLQTGEFAYETDTQQIKVGDGVTAWNSLGYVLTGGSPDHNTLSALQGGTTAEYYHLTNTEHGRLSSVSAFGASLIDDAAASNARTTLGLGTMATQAENAVAIIGGSITGITDLAVADGGTGASTAADARTNLGVPSVSDLTSHTGDTSNPHSTTLELARTAGATFAGNVAMGGNLITGHGSPSIGTDVVNKDYVDNLFDGRKYKDPVAVATTGNVTLSGEQTIDGVLTSASRVLVWQQSTATENGIYVTDAGAWSRAGDADTGDELVGMITNALQGTAYADREFYCTDDSITVGVSGVTIVLRAAVTNHNNLSGLQGGTTAEYYHLTNTQHSALTTSVSNLTTQYRMAYVNSSGVLTESSSILTDASGGLIINTAIPLVEHYATGEAVDNRRWVNIVVGSVLSQRIYNDSGSVATDYLKITRSGTAVTNISFPSSAPLLIGTDTTLTAGAAKLEVAGDVYATGFYDCATAKGLKVAGTQVVTDQQTALTAQLTTITHTAPGVADYALQNMTNTSPYGFVTQDEANTLLSVVANLQTRVSELESKLQNHGLIA